MRCLSCNKVLNDREAVRKAPVTKEYMDLCDACLEPIAEELNMDMDYTSADAGEGPEEIFDED